MPAKISIEIHFEPTTPGTHKLAHFYPKITLGVLLFDNGLMIDLLHGIVKH